MQAISAVIRGASVVAGLGVGLAMGCLNVRPNPNHCSNLAGDETCAERYPGERTFCAWGTCGPTLGEDGCVAERPEDDACYSPCGGAALLDEDGSCLVGVSSSTGDEETSTGEETTSDTTAGSDTESSSTTGPMPCASDDECTDAAAPFCEPVSGECVGCDGTAEPDAACAGVDPAAPLCVGGACVQCTAAAPEACSGKTPVCDEASNSCVPCTAHEQCAGGAACNLYIGACLPADAVVHVGAGQRFATLGEAIASFGGAGAEGTIVVHAGASYDEAATVDGGRVLAFLAAEIGAGVDPPRWVRTAGGTPQLTVTDGTVLMDGVQLSGNASTMVPGLLVDGGRAWLDRSRVVTNLGGGVLAQADAELVLRNCFVGGSVSNEAAAMVNGSSATILYTTIGAGFGMATAVACDGAAAVEIRNSILVAETDSDELQCNGATIEHSAAEMDLGGTNTALGDLNTAWFEEYASGNLHLAATPPITIATTARWETGDPLTDIDREERPQFDGASDVAGADVP